jgi:hypothetical protein
MISKSIPVVLELVCEFYANIHECGEGYLVTWLCI